MTKEGSSLSTRCLQVLLTDRLFGLPSSCPSPPQASSSGTSTLSYSYYILHCFATISCEPPLPALPWSISGTPTYAFWRLAVFRVFSDKPLTHIHSNTEHKILLFLQQDLPPIPLFLLISVNLRPKRIALGSVLLTDCLFWSSLLKVFFISSKFKVCDLLHLI